MQNKVRDFEEDYFGNGAKAVSTQGCRIDSHRTVTYDPNYSAEREARIAAHQERVQKDLKRG